MPFDALRLLGAMADVASLGTPRCLDQRFGRGIVPAAGHEPFDVAQGLRLARGHSTRVDGLPRASPLAQVPQFKKSDYWNVMIYGF